MSFTNDTKPTTTWDEGIEYLASQALEYLMTQDNKYLITNQSFAYKPKTSWTADSGAEANSWTNDI
jgi:hypothetical protein